jgi:hypothetical protein
MAARSRAAGSVILARVAITETIAGGSAPGLPVSPKGGLDAVTSIGCPRAAMVGLHRFAGWVICQMLRAT